MNEDMIFEKVAEVIADQFNVDPGEITMETNFQENYGADSLDLVDIVISLESTFGIDEVEEDVLANIKTVGDVVSLVRATLNE